MNTVKWIKDGEPKANGIQRQIVTIWRRLVTVLAYTLTLNIFCFSFSEIIVE